MLVLLGMLIQLISKQIYADSFFSIQSFEYSMLTKLSAYLMICTVCIVLQYNTYKYNMCCIGKPVEYWLVGIFQFLEHLMMLQTIVYYKQKVVPKY